MYPNYYIICNNQTEFPNSLYYRNCLCLCLNIGFSANNVQIWDAVWLLPMPGYYVLTFRIAALIVTKFQLSPASAAIVLLEQVSIYAVLSSFETNSLKLF